MEELGGSNRKKVGEGSEGALWPLVARKSQKIMSRKSDRVRESHKPDTECDDVQ